MLNRATNRVLSLSSHLSASTIPRGAASLMSLPSTPAPQEYNFTLSEKPQNPLGEGRYIRTAAALIIGDEILNGKTLDRNTHYFANYCFEQGIDLKRVEVIPDEEGEIVEASRRMIQKYDFVITSGGIGPTHDDITYASLAKAFDQSLVHHPETLARMTETNKHRKWVPEQKPEQIIAQQRMALFPEKAEVLFVSRDLWVPVVRLQGKLCIFPGIPSLFQRMLQALTPFLPLPPSTERPFRHQIFTTLPESSIAPFLTSLQNRVKGEGVRVGSYPLFQKGVYVSLIGLREQRVRALGEEVANETQGRVISDQEIKDLMKSKAPQPGE